MKKLFSSKYSDNGISFALLVLRVSFGILLMAHGFDKLRHFDTFSRGFSDPFHVTPRLSLIMVIFAELFCAGLVTIGLMTRLACIPIIFSFIVAIVFAHHNDIFGIGERAALFLFGYIAILFAGPGKTSVDRMIGK